MSFEDQLRSHLDDRATRLDVPTVELHLTPHPERSSHPRTWTALVAVATAAVVIAAVGQMAGTLRNPNATPESAALPELASITQTASINFTGAVELEWKQVVSGASLQLVTFDGQILGIPAPTPETGSGETWASADGEHWDVVGSDDVRARLIVASDPILIAAEWPAERDPVIFDISRNGYTWDQVTLPNEVGAVEFVAFDSDRLVIGFTESIPAQDVMSALPERYRDDPNVSADITGPSVQVVVSDARIPVARFSTAELGLNPLTERTSELSMVWSDDFDSWEPMEPPGDFHAWTRTAQSSDLVFFNSARRNSLMALEDGAFEVIELDFDVDELVGHDGHWAAYESGRAQDGIYLSTDLRAWTHLPLPYGGYPDLFATGGSGVIVVHANPVWDSTPAPDELIYTDGSFDLTYDIRHDSITVSSNGEALYDIPLYDTAVQQHITYEGGELQFLDPITEAVLFEVDPANLRQPWFGPRTASLAGNVVVQFSDGESAWSTSDLSELGVTGWPISAIVTDDYVLISFMDGIWMGTFKE